MMDKELKSKVYAEMMDALEIRPNHKSSLVEENLADNNPYPQSPEENEYRYIDWKWVDEIAQGLTAGAVKHPGETWRTIPAQEHAARAIRHLAMWLSGDRSDTHIINASMRCMMAHATDKEE